MRHLFPLAALLLGSACNASSEEANDHQTEKSAPRIAPTPNSVEAQAQVSDIIGNASEPELRWTGRFAATKALCKTEAWEIGETRVLVAPGSSCDVDRVARAAGQVTLRAQCSAGRLRSTQDWVITAAGEEGIKVHRQEAGRRSSIDLVRC